MFVIYLQSIQIWYTKKKICLLLRKKICNVKWHLGSLLEIPGEFLLSCGWSYLPLATSPRHIRRIQSLWRSLVIPQQSVHSVGINHTWVFARSLTLVCNSGAHLQHGRGQHKESFRRGGLCCCPRSWTFKAVGDVPFSYHRDVNYTHPTSLKTPEQVRER